MRDYELTFIVPPNLEEPDLANILERVTLLITNNGGQITNQTSWGTRRLAYPIQNLREGLYTFLEFKSPNQAIVEIERGLKLSETVLRHLVVRLGD